MELKIPIEIVFDDVNSVIDELGELQKYKLGEGDDMTLVDVDDVADVLTRRVMAREVKEPCGTKEGWIPCSKGLPKYPFRVQIQLDNGWIITGYYSEEHWYTVPHSGGFLRNDEVEAWRELPKAYDGGDAK